MNGKAKIIVNEEKKTVVAIVDGCKDDAVKELLKCDSCAHILFAVNWETPLFGAVENIISSHDLILPDTFVGIAHCHEDDDFDPEVGKSIALKRLHKSYNKAKKQVLKDFAKKIDRFSVSLAGSINKVEEKIKKDS